MEKYNFKEIERKWQKIWEEKGTFHVQLDKNKKKFYPLVEFPYPSALGLHVGHPRSYTALDIIARKRRLEGENVLYPIGFDAFGLPAENFAIKNKVHPKTITEKNVDNFRRQLKSLGLSFDWSREINTTDPNYYKWTQWIFLKFFEKGLAYKKEMPINFCPSCKVGLANEEVVDGKCERCHTPVIHKNKSQWMLKITAYADRLIDDLESVDFPKRVKLQQKNWIGRSYGMEVDFKLNNGENVTVFTTRPDTIFGATYLVLSPEHEIVNNLINNKKVTNVDEILNYRQEAARKSDFERSELNKDKTGVKLEGVFAINPLTKKEIPVFISDYVLITYGKGAIMAVPGHDERDFEFAKKFNLPIVKVVESKEDYEKDKGLSNEEMKEAYVEKSENAILVNSGEFTGLNVKDGIEKISKYIEENKLGVKKVNFKLRDWVFSRQRYWGEPIPIIICPKCGYVALKEEDLPLKLPEVESYELSDNGESPLSKLDSWVNIKCPKCGSDAKRETDTMPQWAGSSWYYLRYLDPNNNEALASKEAIEYWMNVDWYNGGMEHTTLHLLYSRFWHKFLYDIGVVNTVEPYNKRTSHGMILGEDGVKMSKSRGNVVNPDDIVEAYGADTFRMYEMFMGDFEKKAPWSNESIKGSYRFIEKIWNMQELVARENNENKEAIMKVRRELHKTIKKVTSDYETLKANTAIAQMMTLTNLVYEEKVIEVEDYKKLLIILNPVSPHVTEEAFANIQKEFENKTKIEMLNEQSWPKYDATLVKDNVVIVPIQVNGKVKSKIEIDIKEDKDRILALAKEEIKGSIEGKTIVKEIYVPSKIINIVVK